MSISSSSPQSTRLYLTVFFAKKKKNCAGAVLLQNRAIMPACATLDIASLSLYFLPKEITYHYVIVFQSL